MNHAFGRTRQRRRPNINITSLIDVMFLLLIFFMVSSVFRDTIGLDITLPTANTATPIEEDIKPYDIFITSDGTITFNEQEGLTLEALKESLHALLAREPEARMALTADGKSEYETFVKVIDLAREAGGKKLIIHTKPTEPGTPPGQ